jgi:hypothetical protein
VTRPPRTPPRAAAPRSWDPGRCLCRAEAKPRLAFDEAFVDHRQPAQHVLESRHRAYIPPLAVGYQSTSCRGGLHPPDGVKCRAPSGVRAHRTGATPWPREEAQLGGGQLSGRPSRPLPAELGSVRGPARTMPYCWAERLGREWLNDKERMAVIRLNAVVSRYRPVRAVPGRRAAGRSAPGARCPPSCYRPRRRPLPARCRVIPGPGPVEGIGRADADQIPVGIGLAASARSAVAGRGGLASRSSAEPFKAWAGSPVPASSYVSRAPQSLMTRDRRSRAGTLGLAGPTESPGPKIGR